MFLPPTRDLLPGIGQVTKPAGVQTLISQPPIEAFHVAVLPRSSRLNVDQLDLPLLAPAQEMPRGELRSVVTANRIPAALAARSPAPRRGSLSDSTNSYLPPGLNTRG